MTFKKAPSLYEQPKIGLYFVLPINNIIVMLIKSTSDAQFPCKIISFIIIIIIIIIIAIVIVVIIIIITIIIYLPLTKNFFHSFRQS